MKKARHLGKAILILALLASVTGCFSYAAFVSTTPKLDSERALTAEELDALLLGSCIGFFQRLGFITRPTGTFP